MKVPLLFIVVLLSACVPVTPQVMPNATETTRARPHSTEVVQPTDTPQPTSTEAPIATDTPVPTVTPTQTATPTLTPRPTTTPTVPPTFTTVPPTRVSSPTAKPLPMAGITLVSLTSPIARGANATLTVRVVPGATCTPGVMYKSGPSKAQGLEPHTAGSDGRVSWTWNVYDKTTPATWKATVDCTPGGHAGWPFVVQ
jgi:hypothetical protein